MHIAQRCPVLCLGVGRTPPSPQCFAESYPSPPTHGLPSPTHHADIIVDVAKGIQHVDLHQGLLDGGRLLGGDVHRALVQPVGGDGAGRHLRSWAAGRCERGRQETGGGGRWEVVGAAGIEHISGSWLQLGSAAEHPAVQPHCPHAQASWPAALPALPAPLPLTKTKSEGTPLERRIWMPSWICCIVRWSRAMA